eukprot:6093111-Karenia_brevis.AAC.1
MAARAMLHAESKTRTILHDIPYVDHRVCARATKQLDDHHYNIITLVSTLSSVDQQYLCRIGASNSS